MRPEVLVSLNISSKKVIAISFRILSSIVYFPFLSVIEWFLEALLGYSRASAVVLYKAIPNLMFSQLSDIEISISKWRMQFHSNVIFGWKITSSPNVSLAGSDKVSPSLSLFLLAKYTTWWKVKSCSSLIFTTLTGELFCECEYRTWVGQADNGSLIARHVSFQLPN